MTSEEYDRYQMILQQLADVRGEMNARSQSFYDDQVKRFDEYGERTFMSPKQKSWLESLYEDHVGPLANLEGIPQQKDAPKEQTGKPSFVGKKDPEPRRGIGSYDDIDDEIPF